MHFDWLAKIHSHYRPTFQAAKIVGKLKLSLKKKRNLQTEKTVDKPADDVQQDEELVSTTDNPSKTEAAEEADAVQEAKAQCVE